MAAKTKALLFAIAMVFASARAFASIPRSTVLNAPAIDRFAVDDRQAAAEDDNERLVARSLAAALPGPPSIAATIDTSPALIDQDVVPQQLHVFGSHVVIRRLATRAKFFASQSNFSEFSELAGKTSRVVKYQALPFQEPATGLVFARARWYDRQTGSFLSSDPSGYADSSNLYSFCVGDPVNCSDPTGELSWSDVKKAAKGVGQFVAGRVIGGAIANGNTILQTVAAPVTNALVESEKAISTATRYYSAYKAGGTNAVRREMEIDSKQEQREACEKLISMIPGVNTYRHAKQTVTLLQAGRYYDAGTSSSRTEFSAGMDVLTVYGGVKFVQGVGAAGAAESTAPTSYAHWGGEFVDDFHVNSFSEPVVPEPLTPVTTSTPTGAIYSVAFQTQLKSTSYPGVSRQQHFQEANGTFLQLMESDPQFQEAMKAQGINLQRTPTGLAPRTPPARWTWHHAQEPGVMQLVPRTQHTPGSIFWDALHQNGKGGYSIWGK